MYKYDLRKINTSYILRDKTFTTNLQDFEIAKNFNNVREICHKQNKISNSSET